MGMARVQRRVVAIPLRMLLTILTCLTSLMAGCVHGPAPEAPASRAAEDAGVDAVLADVTLDEMWPIVESFSKIDRTSSSAGERRAAGLLKDALERLGIPHRMHEIRTYLSVPVSASLEIVAPERFELPVITPSFSTSTTGGGLTGPLIYVGPRDPAIVTTRPVDFSGVDGRGRIVLLRGYPSPELIEMAERAGAIGAVCIAPSPRLVNMIVSPVWGNPTPGDAGTLPGIPIVTVNEIDGHRLETLSGEGAVTARLQARTDTGWKTIPLLVAEIRGMVEPDRFVLIANHLDSWHEGVTDSLQVRVPQNNDR